MNFRFAIAFVLSSLLLDAATCFQVANNHQHNRHQKSSQVKISIGFASNLQTTCNKNNLHRVILNNSSEENALSETEIPSTDGQSNNEETLPELSDEEIKLISTIATSADASELGNFLMTNLPQMPSHVVLTLRDAADGKLPSYKSKTLTEDQCTHLQTVGIALVQIMDENLQSGRDLLQILLSCGEIRKLDSAIGKAMQEKKLDMAFFTVLNMNIRDAGMEQMEQGATTSLTKEGEFSTGDSANRYQILQHIYTRCQEEVEKTVSPGAGLLNKLLRTDQSSIRANQLRHYLCPQAPKTISSPDGKSVELPGSAALVKANEFIDALQNAVKQIRTVEKTGTVDRVAAVGLVESCRQVAIEARLAIGEGYGVDSEELKEFELSLQPVFRPDNAESEYITGA